MDYDLPDERIARHPCAPRDAARLMVVHRASGAIEHRVFRDLPAYLRPADCLVLNTTRVLPARFNLRRASGGRVGGLFLSETAVGRWRVLLAGAGRVRIGETLAADGGDARLTLLARGERGECEVAVEPAEPAEAVLGRIGRTPLPPYLAGGSGADRDDRQDRADYQTVYARESGSVAAPTAGLHFTPELLARIDAMGVARAEAVLHVGAGTFAPIEAEDLAGHVMHAERYELTAEMATRVNTRRAAGGRVIAVGTTSARTLESCAGDDGAVAAGDGWTRLYITPPHRFKTVDALVTNFHLPRSSLLALVMALGGVELIRQAYAIAVKEEYRFYSFGDAMLIV